MAGVQEILKNLRIGRRSTGLVLLMMVSVSVAFLSWFIVFNFWGNGKEGDWNGAEDNSVDYFEFEETRRSFKQEVICPARQGLELSDYWKCLWSTSITAEGWKQHRRILMEDNMERLKDSMSQSSQTQFSGKGKAKLNVNSKSSSKGRVRRLAEVPLKLRPYDPNDPSTAYVSIALSFQFIFVSFCHMIVILNNYSSYFKKWSISHGTCFMPTLQLEGSVNTRFFLE